MKYPIHEMFYTFQGEGIHMGKPAFFVRMFGCPVHCPWCDSAGTWHPDWTPKGVAMLEPMIIAMAAVESRASIVVLTGGEPAIHTLTSLVYELHQFGIAVHLETSGAFPIIGEVDWVTLSPKKWRYPIPQSLAQADEIKIIVEEPDDIPFYSSLLKMHGPEEFKAIWLHPEWSQRENPAVLGAIAEAVKKGGGRYRAGWQIHKLYQVDSLDPNSRPLVPLGGDMEKGY